ncbi:MAG TPA: hypothetical protein VF469_40600 [Kofleriaceae bacterium]
MVFCCRGQHRAAGTDIRGAHPALRTGAVAEVSGGGRRPRLRGGAEGGGDGIAETDPRSLVATCGKDALVLGSATGIANPELRGPGARVWA